ncbi:MAG: mechanosensitive ion channel [Mariniphaga sp.]|nr:mechanosensitive ion channel [Mariniphaga sp.]
MSALYLYFLELFRGIGSNDTIAKPLAAFVMLVIIFFIAWLAHFFTKKILISIVKRIAKKTKTEWDDILVKSKVFSGLAHLVPAFIIFYLSDFASQPETLESLASDYYSLLEPFLLKLAKIYFAAIIVIVINRLLNAGNEIYNTTEYAHHRPIKGYIQLIKILAFFMAGILIVSVLLGKDPTYLLTGLGAMAAVLLLIFKDTILGFVASIQLSGNDMVKIGDWIEMPSHRADGTVIDITLNTVKVENWDKTIATIPTYSLIAESFNNWEGMEKSDGRRIKRSISIDMGTVKFCDYGLLKKFEKFDLIKDYVVTKQHEIEEFNKGRKVKSEDKISGRSQTNVGIFRKYLEVYLQNHPMINLDMTFLVRQLQPNDKGLPIEIYVFSKDKRWANYESIQADIFDHILAVIPEFELKVYQTPSGEDLKIITTNIK